MNLPRIEVEPADDIETFANKLTAKAEDMPQNDTGADKSQMAANSDPSAGLAAVAPGMATPLDPRYALSLAARLDALVGEFVKLQSQLLSDMAGSASLQSKLVSLFTLPLTGKVTRPVKPHQEIVTDIEITFEQQAEVSILVEPKADHALSPETYLNTFGLNFSGQSEWLTLTVTFDWRDLAAATRFQVSLYARTDRPLLCEAALRLPRKSGAPLEIVFADLKFGKDDRNAVANGELALPDFIELDTSQRPRLVLFFDTGADLSLTLHYLNVYFA
jgi:hypothetical protein